MISDEERREVARRMRAAVEQCDQSLGVFDQEMLSILGIGLGECEGFSNPKDVARLADLIDRPAARNVAPAPSGHEPRAFTCELCGEWQPMDCGFAHCPNCGAEVER